MNGQTQEGLRAGARPPHGVSLDLGACGLPLVLQCHGLALGDNTLQEERVSSMHAPGRWGDAEQTLATAHKCTLTRNHTGTGSHPQDWQSLLQL